MFLLLSDLIMIVDHVHLCSRVNDRRYCIRKSAQLYYTILIYFSTTILCIFDINLLQTLYTLYYTNRLSSILCCLCIFTCIKILLDLFCLYKTALFIYITWCSMLIVCTCVFVFMSVCECICMCVDHRRHQQQISIVRILAISLIIRPRCETIQG